MFDKIVDDNNFSDFLDSFKEMAENICNCEEQPLIVQFHEQLNDLISENVKFISELKILEKKVASKIIKTTNGE